MNWEIAEEAQEADKNKLLRPRGQAHGKKGPISAFNVDLFWEISPHRKIRTHKQNLDISSKTIDPDSKTWPGKI